MTISGPTIDSLLPKAIRRAGIELSARAGELGVEKIQERKHMEPAFRAALTELLSDDVFPYQPTPNFKHWHGVPGKTVGGVDLAVARPFAGGFRALIELKWCPLDGLYLGWAIWDFFKMTTGRVSPGADGCYVIAGGPNALWSKPDTVGELFRTWRWRTENVLRRHGVVWTGDGNDCKKLTALPVHIETTLVADVPLAAPLDAWLIKAIRIEPDPLADDAWLALTDGQLPPRLA